MKYASKLMLNGEEYQFAAPSGGWQPGENTVAYYPLDGDVTDYSSYNRGTMTTTGTPAYENIGSTQKKSAKFTGTGMNSSNWMAYTSNITGLPSSGNFTVSCRIKWNGYYANNFQTYIGYRTSDRYLSYFKWMSIISNTSKVSFHGVSSYVSSTDLPTSGWSNVISVVKDGTLYLYLNGEQVYTTSFSYGTGTPSTLSLGSVRNSYYTYEEPLNGNISEVIIEDKARTTQEISNYYNGTKSLYGIS